ncbi:sporulation kinase [hydrocarbon metagenome]|uniref:histidine kinase n=1 Tax=hydrocarbon metagenome TaxID=938273 RepID=A0A0W8E4R8_9ZZZZ
MIYSAGISKQLLDIYKDRMAELKAEKDNEITLRKEAEEKHNSLLQIITNIYDSGTDIVFSIDGNGRLIFLNKNTEELLGKSKPELIGSSAVDLFSHYLGIKVYTEVMRAMRDNVTLLLEHYDPKSDKWLEINAYPAEDILAVFVRDITERKEAEEALKESKQLIDDIINFLPDATIVIDCRGTVIAWNRAAEEMTGIKSEDILGQGNYAYAVPFHNQRRPMLIDLVLKPEEQWEKEYQEIYRKGNVLIGEKSYSLAGNSGLYLRGTAAPLYDPIGNIIGAIECISDISDHRRTEEALRNSVEMYHRIVKTANEGIWMADADLKITFVNKRMAEMVGYTSEEIIGRSVYDFVYERKSNKIENSLRSNVIVKTHEVKMVHKSGMVFWVLSSLTPIFDNKGYFTGSLGLITDINNRKLTEEALRASEAMYRCIVETANEGICMVDQNNTIILVNKKMSQLLGYAIDEIIGHSLYKFMDQEWTIVAEKHNLLRRQGLVETYEFKYLRKNGDALWTLSSIAPVYDEDNHFSGSLAMITDITERKITEEALRTSEEMYRRIVETANEGIGMTDGLGTVFFVNHKLAEMLGYDVDEIINMSIYDLTFEEDKSLIDNLMQRRKQGVKEVGNIRYRRKDGSALWAIVSVQPIVDDSDKYLGSLGMVTDISENKRLEMEMAHLDQLNLVGEIAAGIGHEIRNPMTAVRGFLQILGEDEKYLQDKEHFNLMIEELDRANSIITEFLSLAKNRVLKREAGDLNDIVAAILPLIQAEAIVQDKHIDVNLKTIPDLLLDEREIRQLILNLVRNGLDAMQPGGILTINTFTRNNEVVLAIKDQGGGLDENIINKLGTPFLTTKENGTGLGLPVCYSIAARHNARITLRTSPSGTSFWVIFNLPPLVSGPTSRECC